MVRKGLRLASVLFVTAMAGRLQGAEPVAKAGPLDPDAERLALHVPDGFEVQLVASEPDIQKPISINFDARGRLWVTGTVEYPFAAPPTRAGRDTVRILDDLDASGKAQKITTFADDLNIPMCALPVGKGAIVYTVPNILKLSSATDSKADQRQVILSTFGHDDTHGMTGAFIENFDGWIYASHGFANTSVIHASDGSEITMQSGNTYRFRPDGSHVEYFTHGQVNPFGMTINSWGDVFSSDCETKPIALLMRGAYYPSFGKPHDGLGFAPEIVDHMYGSTAIAGLAVYAADGYPQEYRDRMFVGNVVTGRINDTKINWRGSSYHGGDEPDFLVSDDPWFRPVNIKLGPDGALYVADFYNRIIGHYEVDLNHPGRDKQRGRIWRIVYKGKGSPAAALARFDLTALPLEKVIDRLGDANLTARMLATNYLVDQVGATAVGALKDVLAHPKNPVQQIHALWVLQRLNALSDEPLLAAASDAEAQVRVHAMRILAEKPQWNDQEREAVMKALTDQDPRVVRVSIDAVGRHPAVVALRRLLDLQKSDTIQADPFLEHGLRMAIRDQLLSVEVARQVPLPDWSPQDARALDDCAAGAPTAAAGELLLRDLQKYPAPPEVMERSLRHAARYVGDEQQDRLADLVIKQYGENTALQLSLFQSVQEGTAQRGGALTEATRAWGTDLATKVLNAAPKEVLGGWATLPLAGADDVPNPWVVQLRASADHVDSAPFWSSLPRGEKLTGVLRSPEFVIPAKLSFFLAGHNGPPPGQHPMKNALRLRLADSREIIAETPPPRSDVAKQVTWDLSAHAGKRGYIEATDGDSAGAYAWLAFGRLDPAVVTIPPAQVDHKGTQAAMEIVATLRLTQLAPVIEQFVTHPRTDIESRIIAAKTLAAIGLNEHATALSKVLENESSPLRLREAIALALAPAASDDAVVARVRAMRTAPQRLQLVLAKSLAATPSGAESLLKAVEGGKASAQLLLDAGVKERLKLSEHLGADDLNARLAKLTSRLPAVDENVQKLIDTRAASFDPTKASPLRGSHVFQKTCIVCHSIETKGARIGPQLDGIGKRGVARICEDIFDPSRNVDAAFRYSTFVLTDGDLVDGIVRREEGETVTVVDVTGKETTIPKSKVKRRVESKLSLMPSNFGETLSEQDFNDLMSYLLAK